jgi:hypothetical protein
MNPNSSYNFASAFETAEVEEEVSISRGTPHHRTPNANVSKYSARFPMIHTVSAHVHAPAAMSDVHDNNSIDFEGLAFEVAKKIKGPVEEGASMARQIWGGLVDDVLGPKGRPA